MSNDVEPDGTAADRFREGVQALTQGAGIAGSQFSVIWVRGDDATTFLDALLSQSVAGTEAGSVRRSLLLTPQGKMRALLWILGGPGNEVGLVTQHSTEAIAVADLTRFRFRVDAAIELETRPVATLVGPESAAGLNAAGLPHPGDGWVATESGLVAALPFVTGELARYVLVGDAAVTALETVPPVADSSYESVRIALGEPLGEVDFSETTISHELGPVDAAVDFTKGCYLGQELVARIDSRGRVNQNLRGVHAAGDRDLLGAGLATIEREVGIVTSCARAPDGNGTIGLALVRREVHDGSAVTATAKGASIPVTIHDLPMHLGP